MKKYSNSNNSTNMRLYSRYIRGKRFSSPKTEKKIMQNLRYLEQYLSGRPLKSLKSGDFYGFIEYLDSLTYRDRPIAATTKLIAIKDIGDFFEWLSHQCGYKRVINYDILKFFKLNNQEKQKIRSSSKKKIKGFPKIEEIREVLSKIPQIIISGRRLRALIAYLFLTGSRIEATSTMKYGLLEIENRIAYQLPSKGVKTKYGKNIITTIPDFDSDLYEILVQWHSELRTMGFGQDDPLFPKMTPCNEEYLCYTESTTLSKDFLTDRSMYTLVKDALTSAGFTDYHCHSFRDSHIYYGVKRARNIQELKAVSLNVGHEDIRTTIQDYGDLASEEVHNTILQMSKRQVFTTFSLSPEKEEKLLTILKLIDTDLYTDYVNAIDTKNNPPKGDSI